MQNSSLGARDSATAPAPPRRGRPAASALLLGLMSLVGNLLGYAFFLVVNRTQTPADIGLVIAVLNLTIVTSVPALAAQLVSARHAARLSRHPGSADSSRVARGSLMTGAGLGLAMGTAALLATPLITWALNLPSAAPALLLALMLPATGATYGVQGYLQGRRRFGAYGLLTVIGAGLRVIAALAAASAQWSASGLLALTAAAAWITGVLALVWIWRDVRPVPASGERTWVRPAIHASASAAVVVAVANLDVPLARHLLSSHEAGYYAALSLFSKAAFWGPAFLATFFFPVMARTASRRHALTAVAATGGLALLGIVASIAFRGPLVQIVGGPAFDHLADLVPLFTAVGAIWSIGQVVVYWGLARGEHWSGYAAWLVLVAAYVVARLTVGGSAMILAGVLVAAATAHVIVGLLILMTSPVRPSAVLPEVSGPTDPAAVTAAG